MSRYVLAIDDDTAMLEYYESLFSNKKSGTEDALMSLQALFDGDGSEAEKEGDGFVPICCNSGTVGVNKFLELRKDGKRIGVCVVDMRMPLDIDGLETAKRLKAIDPEVHILIVTAYSDKTVKQVRESLVEKIYYLKKPFSEDELYQLVYSLYQNFEYTVALQEKIKIEVARSREKDLLLIRQSKFGAMSEILNYIAHHWRQPLNVLGLYIQNIQFDFESGDVDKKYIDDFVKNSFETIKNISGTINFFRKVFLSNECRGFLIKETLLDIKRIFISNVVTTPPEMVVDSDDTLELVTYSGEYIQNIMNVLNYISILQKEQGINSLKIVMRAYRKDSGVETQIALKDIRMDVPRLRGLFESKNGSGLDSVSLELYVAKLTTENRLGGSMSVSQDEDGISFFIYIPNSQGKLDGAQ